MDEWQIPIRQDIEEAVGEKHEEPALMVERIMFVVDDDDFQIVVQARNWSVCMSKALNLTPDRNGARTG